MGGELQKHFSKYYSNMIMDILRSWSVAEIPLHHWLEFLLADWPFGVPFSCGFLDIPLYQPSALQSLVELQL